MAVTRVLIVDDEPAMARMVSALLIEHGFETVVAPNASDALQMVRTHRDICLVISDVVMPGMRGPELVGEIQKLVPSMRAVLMSGCGGVERETAQDIPFVKKPFTVAALLAALNRALAPVRRCAHSAQPVQGARTKDASKL